ncbi:MAG: glycosyltransferase, partial [Butyrivibrio sp.]|nr:glycosyltransferase [Butyrivibrio sp.]
IAEGDYLAFLDSDDLWKPEKLSRQVEFMEAGDYEITCTSYGKIDENGVEQKKVCMSLPEYTYDDVLIKCPGNSTMMYNSNKLGKIQGPIIKKRNDLALWLRIIKKSQKIYGIEDVLSFHRVRSGSLSDNKTDLLKYQYIVYRHIEKLPLHKTIWLLLNKVIQTVMNKNG